MIGEMSMPADFIYRGTIERGRTEHHKNGDFRLKHPSMDVVKRAKIFSPFDALKGFSDALAQKEVIYEDKRELADDEIAVISRKLGILQEISQKRNRSIEPKPEISVTYYVPCSDRNNSAYGYRGQYLSVTGVCSEIGANTLTIDNKVIAFNNLRSIDSANETLSKTWEVEAS